MCTVPACSIAGHLLLLGYNFVMHTLFSSSFSGNRVDNEITCTTPNVMSVGSGPIVIQIDNEVILNAGVTFEYSL